MKNKENRFKIFMILLYSMVFAFQIYYSTSLFINGLDMSNAIKLGNLNTVYEVHPKLLSSRLIQALMQTHSLNVNVLSAFMVLFLILSALNVFDIIYFGLVLVTVYFSIQEKRKGSTTMAFTSLCRLILYIILVICGGVAILRVFLVGNTSVNEVVELGSLVVPISAVFFFFISICSFILSINLELREA